MNYMDLFLLLSLIYGAFRGFSKGLIIEMLTLLGLLFGVFIAIKYSSSVELFIRDFFNVTSRYLSYIALCITFLLVVIVVYLIGKLLTGLINILSLGLLNRLLGLVIGIIKYFVVICVLLLILDAMNDKYHFISEESMEGSFLFYPILNFAQKIYNTIRF